MNMKTGARLKKFVLNVARHECGHFITAKVLGFNTGYIGVTITDFQGGHRAESEIELASKLNDINKVEKYLENRIVVLYAGALSESLYLGKVDNDVALEIIRNGSGTNDHAKAKELIHILRSIRAPDVSDANGVQAGLNEIDGECWNKATELVETESSIIVDLSSYIASKVDFIGTTYKFESQEIDSHPAIEKRFNRPY